LFFMLLLTGPQNPIGTFMLLSHFADAAPFVKRR